MKNTGLQHTGSKADKAPWLKQYRWKSGQSGNKAGKRVGELSLTAAIKRVLSRDQNVDRLAAAIVVAAAKGDASAMKLILDRVDGPVLKQLHADLTGNISMPTVAPASVTIIIPDNGRSGPAPAIDVGGTSAPALLAPKAVEAQPAPAPQPEPDSVGVPKTPEPKRNNGGWVSTWAEKSASINGSSY